MNSFITFIENLRKEFDQVEHTTSSNTRREKLTGVEDMEFTPMIGFAMTKKERHLCLNPIQSAFGVVESS